MELPVIKGYCSFAAYSAEEMWDLVGHRKEGLQVLALNFNPNRILEIRVGSMRMECFKRNPFCVQCGREGTTFLLQNQHVGERPHLNLYHVTQDGQYILMTKDHIKPKSVGGDDKLSNLQTMCSPCNALKGSKYPVNWNHEDPYRTCDLVSSPGTPLAVVVRHPDKHGD